jgi:small-conductance mechanosensitive channel
VLVLAWVRAILGFLLILGALGYVAVSIAQITFAARAGQGSDIVLRIFQLVFAPLILLLSGAILFFQGWRQDPVLQFKDFLMTVLISYLILLDLKRSGRPIQR